MFARRREVKVIKFFVVLRMMYNGALRVEEANILPLDNEDNDAMSTSVKSAVPFMDRGRRHRLALKLPVVSLGTCKLIVLSMLTSSALCR